MISEIQRKRIEQVFRNRLEQAHGLNLPADKRKLTSAKIRAAEVEFFAGAMAAIQELSDAPDKADKLQAPPIWVISLMSGRSIVDQ